MGFLDRLFGRSTAQQGYQQGGYQQAPQQGYQQGGYQQQGYQQAPQQGGARTEDEQAIAKYRYLLRTAPPETIEQAHAEAFAKLSPEQRRQVLAEMSKDLPASERPTSDDAATLARTATRAELRQPGYMERAFGGYGRGMGGGMMGGGMFGGGGMGMGGTFMGSMMGSIAGMVVGTAVADMVMDGFDAWDHDHGGQSFDGADGQYDQYGNDGQGFDQNDGQGLDQGDQSNVADGGYDQGGSSDGGFDMGGGDGFGGDSFGDIGGDSFGGDSFGDMGGGDFGGGDFGGDF